MRSWVKMSAAAAELQLIDSVRRRIVAAIAVVLALQIVALTLMAIGHYI